MKARHIAIIMDGNGRWAEMRGLPRLKGHEAGIEAVKRVIEAARDLNIEYLTLFAFSTENIKRPSEEVTGLFTLLERFLNEHEQRLHEYKIKLRIIGRLWTFSESLQKRIKQICDATVNYNQGNLTIALGYGGRAEIVDAVKKISKKVAMGGLSPEDITEQVISENLYAPDLPDPDLLIRTASEMRISNFLLWQISYTELYFTSTLWPDFGKEDLIKALEEYSKRKRKFGTLFIF